MQEPAVVRNVSRIYTRKSFVVGRGETVNLETDITRLVKHAQDRGLKPALYVDAKGHRSGRHVHTRKEYQRLKADIVLPDTYEVLTPSIDRTARAVVELNAIKDLCKKHGVRFFAIDDNFDTLNPLSASEEMMFNFRAGVAQFWSDFSREKQLKRVHALKNNESGAVYWGQTPWGLKRVGVGFEARMLPHSERCNSVPVVLQGYVQEMSYKALARHMNATPHVYVNRKKQPAPWQTEAVRQIVHNVLIYSGHVVINRKWHSKDAKIELSGDGSWIERYARAMGAVKSPMVEAIISDELASAVIESRFKRRRVTGRPAIHWLPLLSGIAKHRGVDLTGSTQRGHAYYRTRARGFYIDGQKLDEAMLSMIESIDFPPGTRDEICAIVNARSSTAAEQEREQQLRAVSAQMERLNELYVGGFLTMAKFRADYAALDAERKRYSAAPATDATATFDMLTTLGKSMRQLPPMRRRNVLRNLLAQVDVDASGHITGIHPQGWAVPGFRAMAAAFSLMRPKQDLNPDLAEAFFRALRWPEPQPQTIDHARQ